MMDFPLVLVHGYPFDHTMWYSTIAALGSAARVLVPDLPGFGKNSVPEQVEPSINFYADFIAGLLDEHRHQKAVIAGMSMGGYVALAFAEKYPQRLAGLGLISSQTGADSQETKKARKEMVSKIRKGGPGVAVEALQGKLFAAGQPNPSDLTRYPVQGAESAGVAGLTWALEAMARRPDRTAVLTGLPLPVLVVHGLEDRIVPPQKARELAEACRNPMLIEIPNAGHATPLEAPDRVASALARFMEKCREEVALAKRAASQ